MLYQAINALGMAIIIGKYTLLGLLAAITLTNAA